MPENSSSGQLRRLWSAEGVALGAMLVQGLVVARALGPDLYGVYALAFTFGSFVFLVLDPRAGEAVVRYVSEFRAQADPERARAVVRGGFLLDSVWGLGGLAVVALATPLASRILHIEDHAAVVPVVALGLAVAAPVTTARAVLGVFDRFDVISNLQLAIALSRVVSVCAAALAGLGLLGIVWTMSAVGFVECGVFVVASLRTARAGLGGGIRGVSLSLLRGSKRRILGFLGYSGLTTLLSTAVKQVDTLLLGAVAGPRAAGYYRLAKSLTSPAANVGVPLQSVLYPKLARAASRQDVAAGHEMVRRIFWRTEVPLAVAAMLCIPLVEPAIHILAGPSFDGAVAPAIALVVGVAVSFATLHQRPVFLVHLRLRALLAFTLAISVASLVAFVPAASTFGVAGLAWTRTIVLFVGVLAMAAYLRSLRLGENRVTD